MPRLFALSANLPLTKTLTKTPTGIQKTPYPMVKRFTSHEYAYDTIDQLADHVAHVADRQWCLLKGTLTRPVLNESRAGATDPHAPTEYVVLDFDGAKADSVDELLEPIGLADVDHLIQYSSSHGLTPGIINCHVLMMIAAPTPAPMLKPWLMHLNMLAYKDQIRLNSIGTALRWPLDITTCQNDKLIYISAPTFQDMDDPLAERISVVHRTNRSIPVRRLAVDASQLDAQRQELLHKLRKDANLPKLRDSQHKILAGQEYLQRPGRFTISGVKEERGYRYFNFNGGDSWGYFQPLDDPRFVHNFKGEPAYLLEEIAPEFHAELRKAHRAEITAHHDYFSFISPESDTIFNAILDKRTNDLQIMPCANERRAELFLQSYGLDLPKPLPSINIVYDPTSDFVLDHENRKINTYRPPHFALSDTTDIPPTINRVIEHAVGTGELKAWFLKWLRALCVQRMHTGIAPMLHGNPGTGKGVLFHHVLTPLVGRSNAVLVPMERLLEQYNGWLENVMLVGIDESETEAMGGHARRVEANMKTWITEPTTMIRVMRQNPRVVKNHANFILFSNRPSPMVVNEGDRRYQICQYQPEKIALTPEDVARLDTETEAFWNWLRLQPEVSELEVRTIINSDDRAKLIDLGKTTIESVAEHLRDGDMLFLFSHLPTLGGSTIDAGSLLEYKTILRRIALRAANRPDQSYIARDELHGILNHLAGNIRSAPHHFTSLLKHHRIYLARSSPDGRMGQCMHVSWRHTSEWCTTMVTTHLGDVPATETRPVALPASQPTSTSRETAS